MTNKDKVIHSSKGDIAKILHRLKVISTQDLTDSPVLFTGPTGSGKEMLADYLVEQITIETGMKLPFKKINCIGLPEEIIESELFGHEKGAFTGAINSRKGLIEESSGGILFLDEIDVLSEILQAKFLRVLEDREIRKVGGSEAKRIDVRFIAATNRPLELDLKHRFSYKINIPPLKDLPREIPYLLEYFLRGSPFRKITIGTLLSMAHMEWKGNVRELKNFFKEAEISFELRNQEVGTNTPSLVTKEGLFDTVLLSGMSTPSLKRYWTIRAFTNFDEVLLRDASVKKIQMGNKYELYQLFE